MVFAKGVLKGVLQLREREEEEWLVLHRFVRRKETRKKKWKYKRIDWKKSLKTLLASEQPICPSFRLCRDEE